MRTMMRCKAGLPRFWHRVKRTLSNQFALFAAWIAALTQHRDHVRLFSPNLNDNKKKKDYIQGDIART